MEWTFHRFPASLRELDSRYVKPLVVALGPYHHGDTKLQEMENLKRVAADRFVHASGSELDLEEIFQAVSAVAGVARGLYIGDEVAGMSDDEFATMMLYDACFLLQYIRVMDSDPRDPADAALERLFVSNRVCIANDIMLLENQIPWSVVQALNSLGRSPAPVDKFISTMGSTFKIRGHRESAQPFRPYTSDRNPPHLLALFRLEKVGYTRTQGVPPTSSMAITASATELAEMAINIQPCMTSDFMDMGIWIEKLFSHLYLAPLFLDETRACWLVNMAALEVCTASNDRDDDIMKKETAVCSYLALLAMLMNREEDVHELRNKQVMQAKLTDKETLDFFKSVVKRLDGGRLYNGIMAEIDNYKGRRRRRIKVYRFIKKNKRSIIAVMSIIAVLVGIFKTLLSLKTHQ
ncbi:hypothetical protein ACQJBY_062274 [Aegilops geniculata]